MQLFMQCSCGAKFQYDDDTDNFFSPSVARIFRSVKPKTQTMVELADKWREEHRSHGMVKNATTEK
jgi:hypothetical protein